MAVHCIACEREIPAADVNIDTGLAKCSGCNAVFGIMDQVEGGTAARRERPAVAMPKKFAVDDFGGELRIQYRWMSPKAWFLVVFCAFWDGFLVVWYFIAFTQDGPLVMKLFPVLHIAVGVGLTYLLVAMFVNRTTIAIGEGLLRVRHAPLPWPGNRSLYSDDVEQLYCTERIQVNDNTTSRTYHVFARIADGSKVKLISGLEDVDQALFIEQEIERFLRIEDRPVPGEVPR